MKRLLVSSSRSRYVAGACLTGLVIAVLATACEEPSDDNRASSTATDTPRDLEPRLERLRERVDRVHADVATSITSHAPDVGIPESDTDRQ